MNTYISRGINKYKFVPDFAEYTKNCIQGMKDRETRQQKIDKAVLLYDKSYITEAEAIKIILEAYTEE